MFRITAFASRSPWSVRSSPPARITGVSVPARASTPQAGRVLDVGAIHVALSTGVVVAADSAACKLRIKSTMLAPTSPAAVRGRFRCATAVRDSS
jgi:hypothetical protein